MRCDEIAFVWVVSVDVGRSGILTERGREFAVSAGRRAVAVAVAAAVTKRVGVEV